MFNDARPDFTTEIAKLLIAAWQVQGIPVQRWLSSSNEELGPAWTGTQLQLALLPQRSCLERDVVLNAVQRTRQSLKRRLGSESKGSDGERAFGYVYFGLLASSINNRGFRPLTPQTRVSPF